MGSSRPELFCKNGVLANFANTFFKEPFGRLLLHKHSLCLFFYHDLSSFKKRCRKFFLAEYFYGFICRLGTKVSSICKTLTQKPIFNLVKHLGWSFSCKKVNSSTPLGIFAKSSIVDVQPCSKCASVSCSH